MRKLVLFILVLLSGTAFASEGYDIYVYRPDTVLKYATSEIDSIIFPTADSMRINKADKIVISNAVSKIDSIVYVSALKPIFKSELSCEQAILGIYDIIGADRSYRNRLASSYSGYNTDIEKSTKLGDYSVTAANTDLGNDTTGNNKDAWSALYKGVERANLCIYGMEKYSDTTQTKIKYLLGEALTLRAFFYSELIKLWGDVQVRYTPIDSKNAYIAKSNRNACFEKIISDLKRAELLVPWSDACPTTTNINSILIPQYDSTTVEPYRWQVKRYVSPTTPTINIASSGSKNSVERVNKAFVKGLRARIALMYACYALRPDTLLAGGSSSYAVQLNVKNATKRKALYQIALDECADVIAKYGTGSISSGGKLESGYEDIFKKQCQDVISFSNSESLFELPFASNYGQIVNLKGLKTDAVAGGHLLHYPAGHSAAGNITILPGYYYSFDPADTRRDVTASVYKWIYSRADSSDVPLALYTASGVTDPQTRILWQKIQSIDKLSLAKWRFEWMAKTPTTSTADDGVNFCVMRYADILLMYAEAAIGGVTGDVPNGADNSLALAAFNAVHARAGLSSVSSFNMQAIEDERAFEFGGENIRKYDLMRWGLLKTNMDKAVQDVIKYLATTNTNTFPMSKIYIQYTADATLTSDGSIAYKISNIYGNKPGETAKPSGIWKAKSFVGNLDSSGMQIIKTFVYYNYNRINNDASMSSANPDLRQLWPIFQSNINSSKGSLWNDYGY